MRLWYKGCASVFQIDDEGSSPSSRSWASSITGLHWFCTPENRVRFPTCPPEEVADEPTWFRLAKYH